MEGIYQTTADGRIVTVNPALARMLGYGSSDEIVADLRDIDRQFYVDRSRRTEFQRQIEAHGQIAGFESEVYRKDGSTMWISEHGRAVCDENGAVQYYEGTMVDMTERKQAEAAQRKAEEKYRNFFENSIAGIFQSTLDGRLVAVNPALARLLGYDSPEDMVACVTDIDRQLYARLSDRAELKRRLGEDGRVSGFETELCRKDGSTIWIVTNALLVRDGAGQPLCLEGTLVDISAHKQAEQEHEETRRKQVAWIGALEQRTREMSLLNEMSDLIQCCPTVDEAYGVIEQQAHWIFPEESGALYIVNSSRNLAESKAAWGAAFADAPAFKPNDCWGYRRAQLHIAEETRMEGNKNSRPILHCQHLHSPAPDAYMCVPLIAQGETLGVLHLRHMVGTLRESAEAQTVWYTEARQELAHMVADSLALAISNINLRESLRQQSIRDPLTGMFNRRYMEESLSARYPGLHAPDGPWR